MKGENADRMDEDNKIKGFADLNKLLEDEKKYNCFNCVYCVEFGSRVKIGRTSNVYNRIRQIKKYADYAECKIGKIAYIKTNSDKEVEKELHNYFKHYRILGTELFSIEFGKVVSILHKVENLPIKMHLSRKGEGEDFVMLCKKHILQSERAFIEQIIKKTIKKMAKYLAGCDFRLIDIQNTVSPVDLAKKLGFIDSHDLMERLTREGIYFKVNNIYIISGEYEERGYEIIKQTVLDSGEVVYYRRFTQSGVDFISRLLYRM